MSDRLYVSVSLPDLFLVAADTLFHLISRTHHFQYKCGIIWAAVCFYFTLSWFLLAGRLTAVCLCIIISFTELVYSRSLWQTSFKRSWKSEVFVWTAGVLSMNQWDTCKAYWDGNLRVPLLKLIHDHASVLLPNRHTICVYTFNVNTIFSLVSKRIVATTFE